MVRRLLTTLVVFALALGACDAGTDDTTTTSAPDTTESTAPTTTTTQPPSTTTSSPSTTSTTEVDLSGLDLPEPLLVQLEELFEEASEVRGLPFLEVPGIAVVTSDELAATLREDLEEQAEDFPAEDALYELLGLLDPDADLQELLIGLYSEGAAGVYDPETKEILVRAGDEELSVVEQGTMIHELVHALTDQHFEYGDPYRAMIDEERLDQAGAYQALLEGDATFAELRWVQTLTQQEIGQFVAESLQADTGQLASVPQFLTETLYFPYNSGTGFVQALYEQGGWEEVNEAYSVFIDLPGSTEQVITPADYERDLPVEVEMPRVALPGYDLVRTSVWGESGFRIMLNQVLGREGALPAADGWGGDSYHQWYDGTNAALLIKFQGDTSNDNEELRSALVDFANASIAEEDFVWIEVQDGFLYFIVADDTEAGESIRSAVGLG